MFILEYFVKQLELEWSIIVRKKAKDHQMRKVY
jgi:hypothetical protein